jgi:ferredoxin
MSEVLTRAALRRLIDQWLSAGKSVAGPRSFVHGDGAPRVLYAMMESSEQLLLDGFVRPGNSIKELVFPRHEKLYGYKLAGKKTEIVELDAPRREQIVVAARPCDAAALPILDHVFDWDPRDGFYQRHRDDTTVITLACRQFDSHCFCTSVGSGPADQRGSDVMLLELVGQVANLPENSAETGDTLYEVRCLTEKGRRLLAGETQTTDRQAETPVGPPKAIDLESLNRFLADGYENPVWAAASAGCLGCGACAFSCPTCHCFDMIDERTPAGGVRVRNWDACQFGMFTLHASGHNPRGNQGQRQRQRIYHKFQIYPAKFGEVLCTGCGNCTRNCPVGLGVQPVLKSLAK